jgi:hypothetical protein
MSITKGSIIKSKTYCPAFDIEPHAAQGCAAAGVAAA